MHFWGRVQGRGPGSLSAGVVSACVLCWRGRVLSCPCGLASWSLLGHLYLGWFVADDFPVTRWRNLFVRTDILWSEVRVAPQSPQPWTSVFLSTKRGGGGWGVGSECADLEMAGIPGSVLRLLGPC